MLRHLETTRTALITLITPLNSLMIGYLLNREPLRRPIIAGAGLVVSGLLLYEYGSAITPLIGRRLRKRHVSDEY